MSGESGVRLSSFARSQVRHENDAPVWVMLLVVDWGLLVRSWSGPPLLLAPPRDWRRRLCCNRIVSGLVLALA